MLKKGTSNKKINKCEYMTTIIKLIWLFLNTKKPRRREIHIVHFEIKNENSNILLIFDMGGETRQSY